MIENRDFPGSAPDFTNEADGAELEQMWEMVAPVATQLSSEETDAAWQALEARLFEETGSGAAPDVVSIDSRRARFGWTRGGAGVATAAAAAVLAFSLVPVSETAGRAEVRSITLPHGSNVELNSGSTLSWQRGFGWLPFVGAGDRVVKLDGEAFFTVSRTGQSFQVMTGDAEVTVLGTRFNVRARTDVPTRVTVEEGRVAVAGSNGANRVELGAGDRGVLDAAGLVAVESAVDLRSLAWREGGLSLRDLPVSGIVSELERRFDTTILLPSELSTDARMTLYYSTTVDVETVLADLATARGLRYRATAQGWELFSQ